MTDLTTDAGIAAVQARLRGESDRLTDADLDAIEQRVEAVWANRHDFDSHEYKAAVAASASDVPALLDEVRRLRAELDEERLRVRALQAADADHARDRDTIERILAALDGEQ